MALKGDGKIQSRSVAWGTPGFLTALGCPSGSSGQGALLSFSWFISWMGWNHSALITMVHALLILTLITVANYVKTLKTGNSRHNKQPMWWWGRGNLNLLGCFFSRYSSFLSTYQSTSFIYFSHFFPVFLTNQKPNQPFKKGWFGFLIVVLLFFTEFTLHVLVVLIILNADLLAILVLHLLKEKGRI